MLGNIGIGIDGNANSWLISIVGRKRFRTKSIGININDSRNYFMGNGRSIRYNDNKIGNAYACMEE